MQQLKGKKGGNVMSQWAKNQGVLRDQAVDQAMEKAKTDLLYKKYLEREQYVIHIPPSVSLHILPYNKMHDLI